MNREDFKNWLINNRNMKQSVAKSRVSNVARINREYDIDAYYQVDRCIELLSRFDYSKEDAKEGNVPNIDLEIKGDYYTGMQTLKSAFNLYIEYLNENDVKSCVHKVKRETENKENTEGPRYVGSHAGFKEYITASYRNKVNAWAKPARISRHGECEYCHSIAELQSAHKHGREFKDIINEILDLNFKVSSDYYDVDLNEFERIFRQAHTPIENIFYFLCPKCHDAYDKKNTITDIMIESERLSK